MTANANILVANTRTCCASELALRFVRRQAQ